MGHSYKLKDPMVETRTHNVFIHTSMSITTRLPIWLKPTFNQDGFSSSLRDDPCFCNFLGGGSKCGVILVR